MAQIMPDIAVRFGPCAALGRRRGVTEFLDATVSAALRFPDLPQITRAPEDPINIVLSRVTGIRRRSEQAGASYR
jgi:hypothetical protein